MTYQEEKDKILDKLALDGCEANSAIELQLVIDDASTALDELVKKMVIGDDEKPVPIVPGTWMKSSNWQGFRAMERFRNDLRASQRQVMEKGEDDDKTSTA